MMEKEKNNNNGHNAFTGFFVDGLQLALIILKLIGKITVPWYIALLPFEIYYGAILVAVLVAIVIALCK